MSDPFDPTQAGGVPTPPAGNPSVGGPGTGAPVPPDAPPTVASPSIYTDPPVTAAGAAPGGPGGPGGPNDPNDPLGPDDQEPPDDRWKIYLLVGLAVVVIALLIGGIILSQSGDDDGGDTTTSSSSTSSSTTTSSTSTSTTSTSTTTTTAPTTTTAAPTTTTAAGPAGASSPEAASASLYDAWTAGDQANAGTFADPDAVTTLFSRDGVGNDLDFQGCDAAGSGFDCTYSNDSEIVLFTVDEVPRGYRVTAVAFPND
ncbi:MAG: hypothetical protein JNK12_13495 [Acidimicrobiales bacterium]|nr:hypothetical protein [Acidimicrobiales bacterium]